MASESLGRKTGSLVLPAVAASVPAARAWLAGELTGVVSRRALTDAVLVLAELVANSVEHTSSSRVHIAFAVEPRGLVIEVRDQGGGLPDAWPIPGYRDRSRGLMMVAKLTSTFASRVGSDGEAVITAVLPL